MNILILQKYADHGGSKQSLLQTLKALQEYTDVKTHLVCSQEGPFTERLKQLDIPYTIHPLPEYRKFLQRLTFRYQLWRLNSKLKDKRFDWVISNEIWWAPHARTLAQKKECSSGVIIRLGSNPGGRTRKYGLHKQNKIIAVSKDVENNLVEDDPRTDRLIDVIHNPIRVPSFPEKNHNLPENLFPEEIDLWGLQVGTVTERKNQIDSLLTINELNNTLDDSVGLVLAGKQDDSYKKQVLDRSRELKLEDQLILTGQVEYIRLLYEFCDFTLLTSKNEGLPRVIPESILTHTPCFTYPVEGIEEIFGEHVEYFVSSEPTVSSLFEKVSFALKNKKETEERIDELHKQISRKFSPELHANKLIDALDQ